MPMLFKNEEMTSFLSFNVFSSFIFFLFLVLKFFFENLVYFSVYSFLYPNFSCIHISSLPTHIHDIDLLIKESKKRKGTKREKIMKNCGDLFVLANYSEAWGLFYAWYIIHCQLIEEMIFPFPVAIIANSFWLRLEHYAHSLSFMLHFVWLEHV